VRWIRTPKRAIPRWRRRTSTAAPVVAARAGIDEVGGDGSGGAAEELGEAVSGHAGTQPQRLMSAELAERSDAAKLRGRRGGREVEGGLKHQRVRRV
jgi:hypothetical protein